MVGVSINRKSHFELWVRPKLAARSGYVRMLNDRNRRLGAVVRS